MSIKITLNTLVVHCWKAHLFFFFWPGWFNPHGLMEFMMKEWSLISSDCGSQRFLSMCMCACQCVLNLEQWGLFLCVCDSPFVTSVFILYFVNSMFVSQFIIILYIYKVNYIYFRASVNSEYSGKQGWSFNFLIVSVFLSIRVRRLLILVQFLSKPKCIPDQCT